LAVFPRHKAVGKANYNAFEYDNRKLEPLVSHFEYLMNLGKVRATRVVSTLVDGMGSHNNRDASLDVTYLPISMGYRSCYKRYMSSLGYITETTATGAFKIRKEDGSAVDNGKFVSFPTYHTKWKRDYPNLTVSRPVKDICNLCYTFAHCQKFFSDHMRRCGGYANTDGHIDDDDEDHNVVDELARLTRDININRPECASDKVAEEKEQMMLEAAEHVKMARAQRQLYQDKVEKARQTLKKVHSERTEYGAACIQF
jgi:predicted small metal-binding protein